MLQNSNKKMKYLKTQVDDLHLKLKDYTKVYNEKNEETSEDSDGTCAMNAKLPMFVDKSMVSPLLDEYDVLISKFREGKDEYESEIEKINDLTIKLKQSTQRSQTPYLKEGVFEGSSKMDGVDQEKDDIKEAGFDDLTDETFKDVDAQFIENYLSSGYTAETSNAFISLYKDLYQKTEAKLQELKNQNDMLKQQLEEQKADVHNKQHRLRQQQQKLEESVDVEGLRQVATSNMLLVEKALEQRDKCLMKECKAASEVARLKKVIDELMEAAKVTVMGQVEKLKADYAHKLLSVESKLNSFERKKDELEMRMENACRPSQLKVQTYPMDCSTKSAASSNHDAELRDKIRDLEEQQRSLNKKKNEEIDGLKEEIERSRKRTEDIEDEKRWMEEDKKKLMVEVEEMRKEMVEERRKNEHSTRLLSKQVLVLQQLIRSKDVEHKIQLESLTEEHNKALDKLGEKITSSRKSDIQVKMENDSCVKNMEMKVDKMVLELEKERKRRIEAFSLLRIQHSKTKKVEAKLAQYMKNIGALEASFRQSHYQTPISNPHGPKHASLTIVTPYSDSI